MSKLIICDIVYDKILQTEGAVSNIYQNYWDLLMGNDLLEEELKDMGIYFTDQEKQHDMFYVLYTKNGNDISCDSRIEKLCRPDLKKMY